MKLTLNDLSQIDSALQPIDRELRLIIGEQKTPGELAAAAAAANIES